MLLLRATREDIFLEHLDRKRILGKLEMQKLFFSFRPDPILPNILGEEKSTNIINRGIKGLDLGNSGIGQITTDWRYKMVKRIFLLVVFNLMILSVYVYSQEIEYEEFDYKQFCQHYAKETAGMTGAQLENWLDNQKYIERDSYIATNGYVMDVYSEGKDDEGENLYTVGISYAKKSPPEIEAYFYLRKVDKKTALQLRKKSKVKFSGKVVGFDNNSVGRSNINMEQVKIEQKIEEKEKKQLVTTEQKTQEKKQPVVEQKTEKEKPRECKRVSYTQYKSVCMIYVSKCENKKNYDDKKLERWVKYQKYIPLRKAVSTEGYVFDIRKKNDKYIVIVSSMKEKCSKIYFVLEGLSKKDVLHLKRNMKIDFSGVVDDIIFNSKNKMVKIRFIHTKIFRKGFKEWRE